MNARSTSIDRTILILSLSSDIGEKLALRYLREGCRVVGTYRSTLPPSLENTPSLTSLRCDLRDSGASKDIARLLDANGLRWDVFVSCVGQLTPIGPFFDTAFEEWAESVETNSILQLRVLHAVYPFRNTAPDRICHVVFFAGGGTNGPFPAYSAYCLGKIALIKMCELLDSENSDLNAFVVGTGWVRTKIHEQTLAAGDRAGANLERTVAFLKDEIVGTSHEDIAAMIRWGIEQGRAVAGGRNFSVAYDRWREGGADLVAVLRADGNKFKLRRRDNH